MVQLMIPILEGLIIETSIALIWNAGSHIQVDNKPNVSPRAPYSPVCPTKNTEEETAQTSAAPSRVNLEHIFFFSY